MARPLKIYSFTPANSTTPVSGTLRALCAQYAANLHLVERRLGTGWSLEEALTVPKGRRRAAEVFTVTDPKTGQQVTGSCFELARHFGIKNSTMRMRILHGWKPQALATPVRAMRPRP